MADRKEQKSILRWLVCGVLIGAGAILPGVSGGVLAVIFDIYRPFMELLTAPCTALRRYWRGFLPLGIGWCMGFFGFARGIATAINTAEALTTWFFIGLIAGTLPALLREAGREGRSKGGWVSMMLCGGGMYALLYYVDHVAQITARPDFDWYLLCGGVLGLGVVIPGMTTASLLMALGLYAPLLDSLARLDVPVLLPCLLGMLAVMLGLARGVQWLFRRHYAVAFHGILGIVAASTLAIIPSVSDAGEGMLCALLAVIGAALAYWLDRLDPNRNDDKQG